MCVSGGTVSVYLDKGVGPEMYGTCSPSTVAVV